jgi:hypothetical protein
MAAGADGIVHAESGKTASDPAIPEQFYEAENRKRISTLQVENQIQPQPVSPPQFIQTQGRCVSVTPLKLLEFG